MCLEKPALQVITVAGTNGKGSCIACMEAVLEQAGYSSGVYTSPHIHDFNERIRISRSNVSNAAVCEAFALVEQCRQEISLSYFEFATLAALQIFQQADLEVALLEVGLGGRLDAVNIIDPDVAIITNISLDHEDWLGSDLESIGSEKAGILRSKVPVVYGDCDPPASIIQRARELAAPLYIRDQEFSYSRSDSSAAWTWQGSDTRRQTITFSDLSPPRMALCNAATALQGLSLLPFELAEPDISRAFESIELAGRFELRRDQLSAVLVVFDVAHNPAAAAMLAQNLTQFKLENPSIRSISVVLAVLADKDIEGMVKALESCLDICYIAQVDEPRGMPVNEAASRLSKCGLQSSGIDFESVRGAYKAACEQSADTDLVVVTGSFYTVAAVRKLSDAL